MDVRIIATGSSGNAVLMERHTLIDCGVPYKKIEPYAHDIKLVLLTHAHMDHFKPRTVRRLAMEHPQIYYLCGEWMVEPLLKSNVIPSRIRVLRENEEFHFQSKSNDCIETFVIWNNSIHHDVPNCAWHLSINGEKAFYATDTNSLWNVHAKNYHIYLIEANYKASEMQQRIADKQSSGEYAYEMRVVNTHLSQEDAESWLAENAGPNSEYIFIHQHRDRGNGKNDGTTIE